MLQYLINATAIWLLSLLLFELLLKKEAYHNYNRIYLLATFILGICLPLWQWNEDAIVQANGTKQAFTEQIILAKNDIVTTAAPHITLSWQQSLLAIYLLGIAVTLFLLLRELYLLSGLRKNGTHSQMSGWAIVETKQAHGPFSLFSTIYISSLANYNETQLKMLLQHEQQHGRLYHSIDLVLMQLVKIVFWFHPLVYIYYNKLTLIHEYQADSVAGHTLSSYGQFLVEQNMLTAAPAITHAFHRSPIKNRINMLTKKSSVWAKSKILLSVPVIAFSFVCFTKNAFSDDKTLKGNVVVFQGNSFEMEQTIPDTSEVYDPVTGEATMRITQVEPWPIKFNGKTIYTTREKDDNGQLTNTSTAGLDNQHALNSNTIRLHMLSNLSG